MARSCPAIAAKPLRTSAVLRRVRDAGMAPTLTTLCLTVPQPTPILWAFLTACLSSCRQRRVPPPVAVLVIALIPMNAEETDQQKKIRELQAIIAKGLKGINDCRYKTDCEFACACPGTC